MQEIDASITSPTEADFEVCFLDVPSVPCSISRSSSIEGLYTLSRSASPSSTLPSASHIEDHKATTTGQAPDDIVKENKIFHRGIFKKFLRTDTSRTATQGQSSCEMDEVLHLASTVSDGANNDKMIQESALETAEAREPEPIEDIDEEDGLDEATVEASRIAKRLSREGKCQEC
ncbi:hypothetical protein CVT26_006057 [Gymnopilus dilepis]|uniref:Uncharacterized protein n=1 Tax=Gymnopilus dilepis TaxID=231916 RepID=A0A409Y1I8_9AGAR|nr:hypothetical protein CVT26_006057 [Gymnopilus dilepis]